MRSFLVSVCPALLWIFTVFHAVLFVILLRKYASVRKPLHLLTALITLGLFYDALILSLGTVLPAEGILRTLSRMRYVSHGVLIPLIFPICGIALDLQKTPMRILWIFTGILMALGAAEGFVTELVAKEVAGVARFASGDQTPAWAEAVSGLLSYGAVVPLILTGIWVFIKQKTPFLFLSGFLMFAFSALGPATGNMDLIFFISMFGEVCMALFFALYAGRAEKNSIANS